MLEQLEQQSKNIIIPIDFKEPSLKAAKFACNHAAKRGGELLLLYVLETPGLLAGFFSSGDHLVKITDEAKDKLTELARSLNEEYPDLKIATRVMQGKPYEGIVEVAENEDYGYVILGENHQGTDMEKKLGSTVYQVTLKSPIPVLTVKGDRESMGQKVLVPLDLTRESKKKIYSALYYGKMYDAKIYLVSALIGGIQLEESRIYKKLKRTKEFLEQNGLECETKLFPRSDTQPYQRVLEYCKEIKSDMIMIMTHQEGYTRDNYIGAFAHHIINLSGIPVMSLTSSATNYNFSKLLRDVIDPAGVLKEK